MRVAFPNRCDHSVPIVVSDGPSPSGPRIGGHGPLGVGPGKDVGSRYLLTLPLLVEPPTEFSVYLSMSMDEMVDGERHLNAPGVQVFVHPPGVRGTIGEGEPLLSEHP